MEITAGELAKLLSGKVDGDPREKIYSVATLEEAAEGKLALLLDNKKKRKAIHSGASVLIVPEDYDHTEQTLIRVNNPRSVLPKVLELFKLEEEYQDGIHSTAIVDPTAEIGKNVSIGAYCVIGKNSSIGDNTVFGSHVSLGNSSSIGKNSKVYSGVNIYHNCTIGAGCIIHSGAVIGSDGFGYVKEDGKWKKVSQIGKVVIEDNVEIGANTAVDRGAIGNTVIGAGTKIDNLVHIAHNVKLGKSCAIAGQVGFAGSTQLGDNVSVAGQAGFNGHIEVGSNTVVTGKAGVTKNIPEKKMVSGFPAKDHREDMAQKVSLNKLPGLIKRVKKLEKKINMRGE